MEQSSGDTLSEIEAILAPLAGRKVIDIGCGGGYLLKALGAKGVRAAGIDPDEAAVEQARKIAPHAVLRVAPAEALPFPDAFFDAAIFLNSLHHVPVAAMPAALAEAARVVGRGGNVIIVEPLAEGSYFEALRPIEDETRVRLAAQQMIARVLQAGILYEAKRLDYERAELFSTVAAFIDRAVASDPARTDKAIDEREKVMLRFSTLAEREPRGYVLRQPLRLHHLKVPGEAALTS